ncbi:MAG TPA: GFA family protein [Alphaproteobacteria bacterium]|nr:GFA family protein [Alphaproteobacteria bacterium]
MAIHEGSCHCGQVAYSVEADFTEAIQCNCSHCSRKGFLLAFVPPEKVTLKTPESAYRTYFFNKHKIEHRFCPSCGTEPFALGELPNGAKMMAINLRCVPDVDLAKIEIKQYDGANKL